MKKFVFGAIAIAFVISSCSNEETVVSNEKTSSEKQNNDNGLVKVFEDYYYDESIGKHELESTEEYYYLPGTRKLKRIIVRESDKTLTVVENFHYVGNLISKIQTTSNGQSSRLFEFFYNNDKLSKRIDTEINNGKRTVIVTTYKYLAKGLIPI